MSRKDRGRTPWIRGLVRPGTNMPVQKETKKRLKGARRKRSRQHPAAWEPLSTLLRLLWDVFRFLWEHFGPQERQGSPAASVKLGPSPRPDA